MSDDMLEDLVQKVVRSRGYRLADDSRGNIKTKLRSAGLDESLVDALCPPVRNIRSNRFSMTAALNRTSNGWRRTWDDAPADIDAVLAHILMGPCVPGGSRWWGLSGGTALHAPDHQYPALAAVLEADAEGIPEDEHPEATAAETDKQFEERTTGPCRSPRRTRKSCECAHGGTSLKVVDGYELVSYENVDAQGAMGSIGMSTTRIWGLTARLRRRSAFAISWSRRRRAASACRWAL